MSSSQLLSAITRLPVHKVRAAALRQTEDGAALQQPEDTPVLRQPEDATHLRQTEGSVEEDAVVVEEPLEIRLIYGPATHRTEQSISITMRTPGQDAELATGFLFTEGIIPGGSSILQTSQEEHTIRVMLKEGTVFDPVRLSRHFYTTSSCGVCGKSSIDALRTVRPDYPDHRSGSDALVDATLLYTLSGVLRQQQTVFDATGGLHAAALFDLKGNLLLLREDVGRHNALDKLIGAALSKEMLPLQAHILLLSGRACFELIQKAAMAGIRTVIAVGPPSSLAVTLAKEYDMTLAGFLREDRFNIYSGPERIRIQKQKNIPDQTSRKNQTDLPDHTGI